MAETLYHIIHTITSNIRYDISYYTSDNIPYRDISHYTSDNIPYRDKHSCFSIYIKDYKSRAITTTILHTIYHII